MTDEELLDQLNYYFKQTNRSPINPITKIYRKVLFEEETYVLYYRHDGSLKVKDGYFVWNKITKSPASVENLWSTLPEGLKALCLLNGIEPI